MATCTTLRKENDSMDQVRASPSCQSTITKIWFIWFATARTLVSIYVCIDVNSFSNMTVAQRLVKRENLMGINHEKWDTNVYIAQQMPMTSRLLCFYHLSDTGLCTFFIYTYIMLFSLFLLKITPFLYVCLSVGIKTQKKCKVNVHK